MSKAEPQWIEPEMRDEAIRRLREGDPSLSKEWLKLVTGRFAAITQSRMDQARAAIHATRSDGQLTGETNTKDRAH